MTPEQEVIRDGLDAAIRMCHETAVNAGWYTDPQTGLPKERNFGEVTALMHSELSEALEANRKQLMDDKLINRPGEEVEWADTFIRMSDTNKAQGGKMAACLMQVNELLQNFKLEDIHYALAVFKMFAWSKEYRFDLAGAIVEKDAYNKHREDHKLENRQKKGGKAY
jgi:hypothetical protein